MATKSKKENKESRPSRLLKKDYFVEYSNLNKVEKKKQQNKKVLEPKKGNES